MCYKTFGSLNEAKDNCFVVCHALTGNQSLEEWRGSMLGPGLPFDTNRYFIVCANVLGSCYGSTGPQSIDPSTGKMYGNTFPEVTIRDTVGLHIENIKQKLGVKSVHAVVGGSLGGMQSLEWAAMGGEFVRKVVVIGCGTQHDAWQIAISEVQRQAIYADEKWNEGNVNMEDPPRKGLAVARGIAMVSYRTPAAYNNKFGRKVLKMNNSYENSNDFSRGSVIDNEREKKEKAEGGLPWEVKSYLEYQGHKFMERFDAVTYLKLTHKMDSHDIGRGRGGLEKALLNVKAQVMVVGIDNDVLYPLEMQKQLHALIPGSLLRVIRSKEGHDGFILAHDQSGVFLDEFL